jgi:hypothetical protein
MLAANELTQRLLSQAHGTNVHEYAADQSAKSICRFLKKKNQEYQQRGARVEYDGRIIRCVSIDKSSLEERVRGHAVKLADIDPLCTGAPDAGLLSAIRSGVIWWYDLEHLAARYASMKGKVTALASIGKQRLDNVPVVIGGDWEFNAWACPAESYGDFIMVNFGFILAYSYAAMFFEMLDEAKEAAEKGGASGIITSSMIWMAAQVLGYEPFQWDNLRLPTSEQDQIWNTVQHPTDRLKHTIYAVDGFAMLHECGHIACGHTDRLREWLLDRNPSESEKLERFRQMRAMEFEADEFACQWICSQGAPGPDCFYSLVILFSMLRLCEDGRNPLTSLSSTHPCAMDRFRRCLEVFGDDDDDGVCFLEKIVRMIVDSARRRLEWQESLKTDDKPSQE